MAREISMTIDAPAKSIGGWLAPLHKHSLARFSFRVSLLRSLEIGNRKVSGENFSGQNVSRQTSFPPSGGSRARPPMKGEGV